MDEITCENTDVEIWREKPGDFYADSIHVTKVGGIGINCGGSVYVAPVRRWHEAMAMRNRAVIEVRVIVWAMIAAGAVAALLTWLTG